MSVRLLDLVTCTCSVIAPEPVHEAMSHYLHPYLVPAIGQPDVVLAVGCDVNAVAKTLHSLAARNLTTTRTSHPEQRYHVWATDHLQVLLPEHVPNHVISTTGDHVFLTAEQPPVAATIGTRVVGLARFRPSSARPVRGIQPSSSRSEMDQLPGTFRT